MTDYYDINIKKERLCGIKRALSVIVEQKSEVDGDGIETGCYRNQNGSSWTFIHASISDMETVRKIFIANNIVVVVNLAAQAGVRYSITNPDAYIDSNIVGFYNILEACRHYGVEHLVYASSSSVYGSNSKTPYSTADKVDNPVSLYAADRKSVV